MPRAILLLRVSLSVGAWQVVDAQPKRLRIVNGCQSAPIWIAHEAAATGGPDPQNNKIDPGQAWDFVTTDGLAATRYWPKMGCNESGDHCGLGGSGGPGQACVKRGGPGGDDYSRCAPPIDTKFEATFGRQGLPCSPTAQDGCDFIDMSLVDGFTLPFKLEMNGPWCSRSNHILDCSGLTFDSCPKNEMFSAAGVTKDLRAKNPNTGKVSGCYSPCSKLTMEKWGNDVFGNRNDPRVAPYCCPVPPSTPESCRAGPVKDTSFVNTVHSVCPGVYGYSFDDAEGLMKCHPSTQYVITFYCPAELPVEPPGSAWGDPGRGGYAGHSHAQQQPPPPLAPAPPRPEPQHHHHHHHHLVAAACRTESKLCDEFVDGRPCQCGPDCESKGDCCVDYHAICDHRPSRGSDRRYAPEGLKDLEGGGVIEACIETDGECADSMPGRQCLCGLGCEEDGRCCPNYKQCPLRIIEKDESGGFDLVGESALARHLNLERTVEASIVLLIAAFAGVAIIRLGSSCKRPQSEAELDEATSESLL